MTIVNFRKSDFVPSQEPSALEKKVVIAVDGPAASGKGTFAKKMAERLGYAYLDTGALYRAVAMATLEIGADPSKFNEVAPALEIITRNLTPELLASPALRTPEVAAAASKVAAIPEVRAALLDYQREFCKNPPGMVGGSVVDGRDIGTVVCPEADIKFFITASVEERARRRFLELQGTHNAVTYDAVLTDLKARDLRDETRAVAPMKAADDAYILDTTRLTAPQTLEEGIGVIRAKFLSETNDNLVKAGKSPKNPEMRAK